MYLRTVAGIITEMDHIQLVFIPSNCGTYVHFIIIACVVLIIVFALRASASHLGAATLELFSRLSKLILR